MIWMYFYTFSPIFSVGQCSAPRLQLELSCTIAMSLSFYGSFRLYTGFADIGGGVQAYPTFISCVFWSVSWKLAYAYPNTSNRAVPLKTVGVVESLWYKLSEKSTKKTLHRHLKNGEVSRWYKIISICMIFHIMGTVTKKISKNHLTFCTVAVFVAAGSLVLGAAR